MRYREPLHEHIIIKAPMPGEPVPTATLQHLRVKGAVADARRVESDRRADALETRLDQMGARVAELEHPAEHEPQPALAHVEPSDGRAAFTPDDVDWIVDGWRRNGWQS